jgi:tetratricopeptide (TPR) repeat protein
MPLKTLLGAALVLAASAALAQPAPSYDDAMKEGRAANARKDAAAAVAAFRRAVAARPRDARALSELSAAALVAGDFAAAKDAAEQSVAAALDDDPKLAAASYYNLGRADEGLGDTEGARRAYGQSLALRENKETRARWEKLGGGDPFVRHKLAGPFEELEEFCGGGELCDPETNVRVTAGKLVLGPPWNGIARIKRSQKASDDLSLSLGLRIGKKWWVLPDIGVVANRADYDFTDVKMVGGRVVLHYATLAGRFDWDAAEGIIVCGAGADRKPSCYGPIQTYTARNVHSGGKESGHDTLTITLSCGAELAGDDVLKYGAADRKAEQEPGDKVNPASPEACAKERAFGSHKLTF